MNEAFEYLREAAWEVVKDTTEPTPMRAIEHATRLHEAVTALMKAWLADGGKDDA